MIIKSNLTKLEHTISNEDWSKMVARGSSRNFSVISNNNADRIVTPESIVDVNYGQILKKANRMMKDEDYSGAKTLFLKASRIKETPLIIDKLAELENLMA